ncbi:Flagellar biosynthesis protein FlhA [Candidatus Bealeia paramacronuclearis]|uniref:Flagellar biosynthesis protein FlhA n=1 Tax=Candidatus Bealeia paramacronuclearis TaxID=1921001 RepID=A0ABZ2C3X1_9PROT|nr:Flagellar biosynthesis protein FlhA [Candidatus Bealeia paramacronuclearis]
MAQGQLPAFNFPDIATFGLKMRRSDIAFALGLMAILVFLILPMPKFLLDICLALSITFSVMILMTSLFIQKPLEFSAFPTILLVSTMLRLSLNVASTRLILADGSQGPGAAGEVIRAFGGFLMSGNFVIGVIIFMILITINFVVITKGSGRIAEVAARFSLDSMPGKQMAVDADLSAGIINEQEAKKRRKELEEETNFYGSMDGAAKFVRGDAIAGLIITFINIVGGILIGVMQGGMTFSEALHTYSLLTVGDGLVTQIPALIISTAAGMLVSKSGTSGSTDKALFSQLGAYPAALGLSSFLMTAFAIIPGIPMFPFLTLALITGLAAWKLTQAQEIKDTEAQRVATKSGEAAKADGTKTAEEETVASALHMDLIRLKLGYGLLSLVSGPNDQRLTDQIKVLRKQLATEMGFVLPSVRIMDNLQLGANDYIIRIKEIEVGRGELRPHMYLVMDPQGQNISLPGEPTIEPTFGLPAMWISEDQKTNAENKGYTVVDIPVVVTTHLTEVIKDNMSDLLSFAETQKLLDELDKTQQKLLTDIVPNQISQSGIQRVLQNLLNERVSIRDLSAVLEGIAESCAFTRNLGTITEHVRARLSRQLCAANSDENGSLPLVTLSPAWEEAFNDALLGDGETKHLALSPSKVQEFMLRVREIMDDLAMRGEMPVILTGQPIRVHVRSIIERFRPSTVVMSQAEIHPKVKLRNLGQL